MSLIVCDNAKTVTVRSQFRSLCDIVSAWALPIPGSFKLRWDNLQAAILGCFDAILRHALAVDPPLGFQHRLNDVLAATAERYAHLVVLSATQQALAV